MSLEFEYLLYYLKYINNNNRKKHKIIASQSTVIIDQSIKMNEPFHSTAPEPRKIGVWTEGAPVETREFVMPKKSSESIDDIPTIPDLDDLQDILEMEILKPPMSEQQDKETVNTLAEVRGVSGSVEGIDAALEVLKSYIPVVEPDTADTVWTVDTLIAQLAEELLTE